MPFIFQSFKITRFLILPHVIPGENLSIHCNINPLLESLDRRKRAAKIEQCVGDPKRVRNHGPYQNNRLTLDVIAENPAGFHHRIRSVRYDDFILLAIGAPF